MSSFPLIALELLVMFASAFATATVASHEITSSVGPFGDCKLDLDLYTDLASPLFVSGEASPYLSAKSLRRGFAEYALPPCALDLANVTRFALRGRIRRVTNANSPVDALCNVTLNAQHATLVPDGGTQIPPATEKLQFLGLVSRPLLSPRQPAIVFEGLSPHCCIGPVAVLPAASNASTPPPLDRGRVAPALRRPCWRADSRRVRKVCPPGACAYATLILNDRFAAYAYALQRSLALSGSSMPLVVLATDKVSDAALAALARANDSDSSSGGLIVHRIGRVAYPSRYKASHEDGETRKSERFTKLEAWRLTAYRKVVLIDTDTMVLRPLDALFTCDAGTAVADQGAPGHFNSGIFVLEPAERTYNELRRLAPLLHSYNQGDQGFLNKAFPEWRLRPERQLPERYNFFLKWRNTNAWFGRSWTAGVHVVHFTDIVKPHNWYVHPIMRDQGYGPPKQSFVAQHGDMFQQWTALVRPAALLVWSSEECTSDCLSDAAALMRSSLSREVG